MGQTRRRSQGAGAGAIQEDRHDGRARPRRPTPHCAFEPTKRSADFIALLEEIDRLYGPHPGLAPKPVVIVLDNGLVHTSKATLAALAARAHWLTVEWLPKYAPELNDIEVVWHDLKAHNLAHQTFTDTRTLDQTIHAAVTALNLERNRDLLGNSRISA
ncbi:MAG: transposase [Hyphomicrobiaceae bacterium]|nr:transposase [Hyphomicrobiaceae bacterium]